MVLIRFLAGSVAVVGALSGTTCSATNPGTSSCDKIGETLKVNVVNGWASTTTTARIIQQYRSRVLRATSDLGLGLGDNPGPGSSPGSSSDGAAVLVTPVAATATQSTASLYLDRPTDAADPFLAGLVARVARTVGVQARRCEPVVLTRYLPPQRYGIHHDAGYVNRSHTFLLYLADVAGGGQTIFPRAGAGDVGNTNGGDDDADDDNTGEDAGYADDRRPTQGLEQLCAELGAAGTGTTVVTPVAGRAVWWPNLLPDGTPNPAAVHGSCPVSTGIKWIFQVWINADDAAPTAFW